MQYILTQQELDALRSEEKQRTDTRAQELQALCTLAAQHIPVVVEWSVNPTPRPWGCILGPREQNPGYCDRCPARKVCPHPGKEWSK